MLLEGVSELLWEGVSELLLGCITVVILSLQIGVLCGWLLWYCWCTLWCSRENWWLLVVEVDPDTVQLWLTTWRTWSSKSPSAANTVTWRIWYVITVHVCWAANLNTLCTGGDLTSLAQLLGAFAGRCDGVWWTRVVNTDLNIIIET